MTEKPDPAEVVLHAETPRTALERIPVGAVRVRRVVVTERRLIEVEVSREELVVEYLDTPPADAGGRHRSAAPGPVTLTLHEERVDVAHRVVPVERVTVHIDQVEGTRSVPVVLRREVAELDRS